MREGKCGKHGEEDTEFGNVHGLVFLKVGKFLYIIVLEYRLNVRPKPERFYFQIGEGCPMCFRQP